MNFVHNVFISWIFWKKSIVLNFELSWTFFVEFHEESQFYYKVQQEILPKREAYALVRLLDDLQLRSVAVIYLYQVTPRFGLLQKKLVRFILEKTMGIFCFFPE